MGTIYSKQKDQNYNKLNMDDRKDILPDMMYLFGEDDGRIFSFNPEKHTIEHVTVKVASCNTGR
jgi:hypothetical protein